ncbi:MAG: phage antirepressor KilAC domain-containing protein [Clostridium sp.]|jgi:anti-repressor protein
MDKSLVIKNQLIPLKQDNNGRIVVDGRELHDFLLVQKDFSDWIKNQIESVGAIENVDFIRFPFKREGNNATLIGYDLTVELAKEICMVAGVAPRANKETKELSKKARQYFIQVEKYWNSPEMIMKRALEFANRQVGELETKVFALEEEKKLNAPKVIFADAVSTSKTSILIGELAKILKQNGIETGQRRLFEWLRINKYLISRKGTDYNMPTQKSMELGLFEIKETSIAHADGHTSISKTPKVTGKGQQYFINKFLD